jgi:putative ABC transport system permease protein
MSWFHGIRRRLTETLHPQHEDESVQQELRDHVEREVARHVRDGLSPDEARRRAAIRSGSVHAAREAVGDERSGRIFEDAAADLRFSARALRRNPGFTAAVVISLALGVGGTTAVFGVVNAVLLRPLPYPDSDRLFNMRIWWADFSSTLSPADLEALNERPDKARFGAYFRPDDGFAMETPAGPELVSGAFMTASLPYVLQVQPILGAGFSPTANAPEALIGEKLWRQRYQASPDAIGRTIVFDGDPYSIVGVMPDRFNVPGQRDGAAWLKALSRQPTRRGPFYLTTMVRLEPDLSAEAAAARFTAGIRPTLQSKFAVEPNWEYRLRPMKDTIVGNVRPTLLLVLGAMALVLLIAIVNVTNLFLARGTVRAGSSRFAPRSAPAAAASRDICSPNRPCSERWADSSGSGLPPGFTASAAPRRKRSCRASTKFRWTPPSWCLPCSVVSHPGSSRACCRRSVCRGTGSRRSCATAAAARATAPDAAARARRSSLRKSR